jgi:hypothetical protein
MIEVLRCSTFFFFSRTHAPSSEKQLRTRGVNTVHAVGQTYFLQLKGMHPRNALDTKPTDMFKEMFTHCTTTPLWRPQRALPATPQRALRCWR